jgi:amidase
VRTSWAAAVGALFARFDFLAAPTAQVFPFDVATHWPASIAGTPMATYHEWMKMQFLITLTGRPSLAMPAGFSPEGLPMGVQIVGPERGELACLGLARAYDEATRWPARRPPPLLATAAQRTTAPPSA